MGDSSCQGSPGHCLGLGGHVRLPGEVTPATLSHGQRKATERGQLGTVLGWGLEERAGGETLIIAVRCPGNTRDSWEPCGGWERQGRGSAWF